MTRTKKLDIWIVISFVLLLSLVLFTVYPVGNLLTIAFRDTDGHFTLKYFK